MKNYITFILILTANTAISQTIRIADNNATAPTGTNIFTGTNALQNAINAAVANDIVYVQPSVTTYGDVIIDKAITLRGIGFNTGKDFAYTSLVNKITLTNRVDNTSNATNSVIEGLQVANILIGPRTGTFTYTLQNVRISNCRINALNRDGVAGNYQPVQNLTITGNVLNTIEFWLANVNQFFIYGNYIIGGISNGCSAGNVAVFFGAGTLNNLLVANNIFNQSAAFGVAGGVSVSGATITNNNFLGGSDNIGSRLVRESVWNNASCVAAGLFDISIVNNIFYGYAPTTNTSGAFERNAFGYNLVFGTTNNTLPPAGTGVGNTNSGGNLVNPDPLFVNAIYNTVYSSTMNFNLQSGSPARNAGNDGTDIGITGGAYPITAGNISLRPSSTPVILSFTPAPLVPQNQTVKTNIKAKSN